MKIVKENFLNYKDTYIYQDKESFCYGIDSVLLANFIQVGYKKNIIDLATGNIPIPLLLYKKYGVCVDCIELQKDIYDLGTKTIVDNQIGDFVHLYHMNICDVDKLFKIHSYDIVSINPPYFKQEKKNSNEKKTLARHEVSINLETILTKVNYLLNERGHFYMIHRTERFVEIINLLEKKNLIPKRVSFVYPTKDKNSKLFLVECIKNGKEGLIVDKPVIIYDEKGNYTKFILEMLGGNDVTKEL